MPQNNKSLNYLVSSFALNTPIPTFAISCSRYVLDLLKRLDPMALAFLCRCFRTCFCCRCMPARYLIALLVAVAASSAFYVKELFWLVFSLKTYPGQGRLGYKWYRKLRVNQWEPLLFSCINSFSILHSSRTSVSGFII